jgi:hypothetical protein
MGVFYAGCPDFNQQQKNYKIMKRMRLMTAIISLILLQTYNIQAQDINKVTVNLELKNATLENVFDKIEQATTFKFNYRSADIAGIRGINYMQQQVTVKKVLDDVLSGTALQYEQVQQSIIIKKNKKQASHQVTVFGFVKSAHSGETLTGATVVVSGNKTWSTITNAYGFYSVSVPAGSYRFSYTYIGFRDMEQTIDCHQTFQNNIELTIKEDNNLQSVTVSTTAKKSNVRKIITGNHHLSITDIKKIAMPGGEPDVLKSLQFLPGIQTSNEGTTNLSVRGGSFDQNLILLDEAPVYNPSHTLGFFSAFNTDALKDVSIYKGVFPAQYGGRLSSVVDIRMKEGNSRKYMVTGGIGLLASRLTVEGPIKKDQSSFMLSGRYSDIGTILNDTLVGRIFDINSDNNRINYYDLNAKFNTLVGKKDRLYFSAYTGHDNFYMHLIDNSVGMAWGNTTVTARWNHVFNPGLFANTSLLYSNYDYSNYSRNDARDFTWKARLQEITWKTDVDWAINTNNHVKFGTGITWQQVLPGKVIPDKHNGASQRVSLNDRNAAQLFAYINNEQKLSRRIHFSYGLRATWFASLGETMVYRYNADTTDAVDSTWYTKGKIIKSYFNVEPRLTAGILLSNTTSLKISYGRNYQYQHLLTNSSVGLPTDIWLPSDTYFKPQHTDQFAAGVYTTFHNEAWEASAELYYRQSHNIIDFKDNAEVFMNSKIETQILSGHGKGYGAELLLRKNKGALTGWVSYTWSKALRRINGINNNEWYPPVYDHRHNLSFVFNYRINQRLSVSGNWIFRSGGRTTIPLGTYTFGGRWYPYYGKRNAYVMPASHRFDLSVTWQNKVKPKRKWQGEWVLSIYNVYNRPNVFALYVSRSYNSYLPKATHVYLAGILPTVTYNFKF